MGGGEGRQERCFVALIKGTISSKNEKQFFSFFVGNSISRYRADYKTGIRLCNPEQESRFEEKNVTKTIKRLKRKQVNILTEKYR